MGVVSPQQSNPGDTIEASDINNPINTLAAAINGNLDNNNISSVSGSKITAATIPGAALDTTTRGGWIAGVLPAVSSVTYNGNRSYDVTHASTAASILTPGMRVRFTRSSAAPTQCTSLNGTTQYWSKATPNKSAFTDDFVAFGSFMLTSYAVGTIISVYNGTSGWALRVNASGQIQLIGYNAGAANFSQILSNQSLALNKRYEVYAQLDMSSFTNTATTSFILLDGADIPGTVSRGGTSPTALVQAGNLNVGAENGGTNPFPGKIFNAGWFTAKVTQATLRGYSSQAFSGSETSIGSVYNFSGVATDVNTTTPNDLTANGSATATTADSKFAVDSTGTAGGSYEYGIVTKVNGTTVTYQVPEGCAIPTTGGVSAVDYSPWKAPLGLPVDVDRWRVELLLLANIATSGTSTSTIYNPGGVNLTVPLGVWNLDLGLGWSVTSATTTFDIFSGASTSASAFSTALLRLCGRTLIAQANTTNAHVVYASRRSAYTATAATPLYLLLVNAVAFSAMGLRGSVSTTVPEATYLVAEFGLL